MDWKQKDSKLCRLVLVVWISLITLKYCFGNKTTTFVLNGTTSFVTRTETPDSFLVQATSPILATSVGHGSFMTLSNVSVLSSSIQTLKPKSPLSTNLDWSSTNVVLEDGNSSFLVQATSQILATSIGLGSFMTLSNVTVLSSSIQPLKPKFPSSTNLDWSSTNVVLEDGNTTSTSTENSGSFLVQATSQILTTSIAPGDFMNLSNLSLLSSSVHSLKSSVFPTSSFLQLSSSVPTFHGPNKTFIAEIRIKNLNFTSELDNKTSSLFHTIASVVTASINFVMKYEQHYFGCQIVSFRPGSVITNFAIRMGPGSNSDPNLALDRLKTAVASGRLGNLTVDSTYFEGWLKQNPAPREKLLSGQLAGVAVIFFILVALLLVICLGSFADEPLFEERELFSAELTPRNVESGRDNEGSKEEEEEWKYDPLFAWSHKKVYNSKL